MSKLTCTKVETIAWDNQSVTLDGDDVSVIIRLKSQEDFGIYKQGEKYDFTLNTVSKASKKKKA